MTNDMGSFRIDVEIENPAVPDVRRTVSSLLVDTGAELSCIPAEVLDFLRVRRRQVRRFRQADGSVFERWTGAVIIYAAATSAGDEVIFGEPGDLVLIGSRTLEGLNLMIDPISKRLIDAGPMPLAAVMV